MRNYEIKKGHVKEIEGGKLRAIVEAVFGECKTEDDRLVTSFGALRKLSVWTDGKSLFVDTEMDPEVSQEVATETIKFYNRFLERATGFSFAERRKRLQARARSRKL